MSFTSLTFNVLFNKWHGLSYKKHLLYHQERYLEILKIINDLRPTFVTLNEVTDDFMRLLQEQNWINNYPFISPLQDPFGNIIMSQIMPERQELINLPKRKVPIALFKLNNQTISVSSIHLTAREKNVEIRKSEWKQIVSFLGRLPADIHLCQGDFNFHSEEENEIVEKQFLDCWKSCHPNDPGFTFDAIQNKMIQEMWPLCEKRQMRLDRIYLLSNNITCVNCKLIGNQKIYSNDYRSLGKVSGLVSYLGDLVGYNWFRQKEEYLFCSDHFGILAEFSDNGDIQENKEIELIN